MLLVACTVVIFVSDFRSMIIPDWVNLGLLSGGLLYSAVAGWQAAMSALVFGVVVFTFFWGVRELHFSRTGRVGLGMGDVKFAGAAATWLSPFNFPVFLLGASISALLYFAVLHHRHPDPRNVRVPFGPFLSLSLLAVWHLQQFNVYLFGYQT